MNGLIDFNKHSPTINIKDGKILEEFVSLFQLFNEATVITPEEAYVTISLVAPIILSILHALERELSSLTLILVSLCKTPMYFVDPMSIK